MLIIGKLHKEFPRRVVEWGLSWILISWGMIALITDGQWEEVQFGAYIGWVQLAPQLIWGFSAFGIGIIRLAALYVNGAHVRSPMMRTIAGFFSMFIWFGATVGTLKGDPILIPALAIYPWLMVADGYAVYTSSGDAYQSLHPHRESLGYGRG